MEKARVYTHTLLRLQFPDRVTVMAKFHPQETVADVRTLLANEIFSTVRTGGLRPC
jgi:hypothetical protein